MKAPPVDGKGFSQYEAVFLQLADEHRTVNAFELQELLEACLPNGKIYFYTFSVQIEEIFKNAIFFISDYIKSCACMDVCRQVILSMDVSFLTFKKTINYDDKMSNQSITTPLILMVKKKSLKNDFH